MLNDELDVSVRQPSIHDVNTLYWQFITTSSTVHMLMLMLFIFMNAISEPTDA